MTRFDSFAKGTLRPGIFRLDSEIPRSAVSEAAKRLDFRFFMLKGSDTSSKRDFLELFANNMNFPDYFGFNWDAFIDSVTDLSWLKPPLKGIVIVLPNLTKFAKDNRQEFHTAFDCLNIAVDRWWERHIPMYILLTEDDGELPEQEWLPAIKRPWDVARDVSEIKSS